MEDYKQKYEETIERVKEMYLSQPYNCEFTAPFKKAFPEAKEWEEEKTKADILRFINSHLAGFDVREKYVNWIEKHSEEKKATEEAYDKIQMGESYRCIDSPRYTFFEREKTYTPKDAFLLSLMNLCHNCFVPVGKPKFKEGDWIISEDKGVHKDYAVCKIVKIEGDKYSIEIGGYLVKTTLEQYEYRLWSIQDARAGDILKASDDSLFIYNGKITTSEGAGFYVACTTDGHISITRDNYCGWEYKDGCQPSTQKEQEFLLSKIEEAGYKWDADTLELKKIEEQSTELLKGEDYGIDGLYCAFDILKKTLGNVDGYQTDDGILEHKIAIDTIKDLYISRNTKWTKEDDDMYDRCLMALANWRDSVEQMGKDSKSCQEIIDWLRAKING